MTTNLVQIPQDVLVYEILNKLAVPDLIHVLKSNKNLQKYNSVFEEKIEDYQDDLKYRKSVAGPKYIENVEAGYDYLTKLSNLNQMHSAVGAAGIRTLDNKLAQSMDVESSGLPRLRGQILYPQRALVIWWLIYVRDNNLIHSSSTPLSVVIIADNIISNLINIPLGSTINFDKLINKLLIHHTQLVKEKVSDSVLYALNQEIRELGAIYSKYEYN